MKTLKEYANELNRCTEQYPDALVVSASDEEGNSFSLVGFSPTLGHYSNRDFESVDEEVTGEETPEINAVCIN